MPCWTMSPGRSTTPPGAAGGPSWLAWDVCKPALPCRQGAHLGLVLSQPLKKLALQYTQEPHAISNEATALSPFFRDLTSGPTASTTPMNSWPCSVAQTVSQPAPPFPTPLYRPAYCQ